MPHHRHRSGDARADRRAEYAEEYARAGDVQAAIELMQQALELAPGWPLGRLRLGEYLEATGQHAAAASAYAGLLADGGEDVYGAGLKLAALGLAPVPQSPPPAFVASLFDQYADRFETALVERLGYSVPSIIAGMLEAEACRDTGLGAVLDLGCGTGLMGSEISARVSRLEGLDLSAGMLSKARQKHIYDALHQGDICHPPADVRSTSYDLVTAADVLIYLGDLAPLFTTVRHLLKPGGRFVFSVETAQTGDRYTLGKTLRYAHAQDYVTRQLARTGLAVAARRDAVLRQDKGIDVAGDIYMCHAA